MRTSLYNIVFRPEPEGGFTVLVPSLPGCLTWAPTIAEGKRLIQDAIDCYLASMRKRGETPQDDLDTFTASINLPTHA